MFVLKDFHVQPSHLAHSAIKYLALRTYLFQHLSKINSLEVQ